METLIRDKYKFLGYTEGSAEFIFSTAYNGLNFQINTSEGTESIKNLTKLFNIKKVGYLKQIHSDRIFEFNDKTEEGDALITDRKGIAIGIFTADCVPVLLYDRNHKVCAAVHCGWRGTYSEILIKTIEKMKSEYCCRSEDITAAIGPHNRICCYEIGTELIELFTSNKRYKGQNIIENGRLNLEVCIIKQLTDEGINNSNIITADQCTYCSRNMIFHSYRKDREKAGRMFSFVYMK